MFDVRGRIAAFAVACCVVVLLGGGKGQAQVNLSNPGHPYSNGPAGYAGDYAIKAMGQGIGDVARAHGWTADILKHELSKTAFAGQYRNNRLDSEFRMFTREGFDARGAWPNTDTSPAPFPLDQTFALNSYPEGKRTIALVFRGYSLTGTKWNSDRFSSFVLPPFSVDDDTASFTDDEKTRIQKIWARIAEDFAPFDVNVTTAMVPQDRISRSGPDDEFFGIPVVFSKGPDIRPYFSDSAAYFKSFGEMNDLRKPIMINANQIGQNTPKFVAEAASHMIGHALGLRDDEIEWIDEVSGALVWAPYSAGRWAPIMGDPTRAEITSFSNGDFANSNNTEDDFAVMRANGLPLRADDFGYTRMTPAPLTGTPNGTNMAAEAKGIIERANDWDVFSFNAGAGPLSATLDAAAIGPNTNLSLVLLNKDAVELAKNDPPNSPGAALTYTLPAAGTYYLQVRAQAPVEDPSIRPYGNRGAYSLGVTYSPTAQQPPSACFTATRPAGLVAGQAVQFAATATDDRGIRHYAWDFGDGTGANPSSQFSTQKTYAKPGIYSVRLRVQDVENFNTVATRQIRIYATSQEARQALPLPQASFTASVGGGAAPLTVTFDAAGSTAGVAPGSCGGASANPPANYKWSVSSAAGTVTEPPVATPTYPRTFTEPGEYTVALSVQDSDGRWSQPVARTITVSGPPNQAPTAAFTVSATTGPAPLAVSLGAGSSSDDNGIVSYRWDFADGSAPVVETDPSTQKTFTAPGTYRVTLRVTDAAGLFNETSRSVTVLAADQPPVARLAVRLVGGEQNTFEFDPAGSTDDSGITAFRYEWPDGSATERSDGAAVRRVLPPGQHIVVLTVTDRARQSARTQVGFNNPGIYHKEIHADTFRVLVTGEGANRIATAYVTVKGHYGEPIPYATVNAQLYLPGPPAGSAVTDANGRAAIVLPVPAGTNCVWAGMTKLSKSGHFWDSNARQQLRSCYSTDVPDINVSSSIGLEDNGTQATVKLTFTRPDGTPVVGSWIMTRWTGPWDSYSNSRKTDSNGSVSITSLPSDAQGCIRMQLEYFGLQGHSLNPYQAFPDLKICTRGHAAPPLPQPGFDTDRLPDGYYKYLFSGWDENWDQAVGGQIVAWFWDMGDGTLITSSQAVHEYQAPGRYTVRLSARDTSGRITTRQSTIVVTERPRLTASVPQVTFTETAPGKFSATIRVQVSNGSGVPEPGVSVGIQQVDGTRGMAQFATTDANGIAEVSFSRIYRNCAWAAVSSLDKDGFVFARPLPSANTCRTGS